MLILSMRYFSPAVRSEPSPESQAPDVEKTLQYEVDLGANLVAAVLTTVCSCMKQQGLRVIFCRCSGHI